MTSGSIILMHDGGGNRDQDVEALPRIIESLQSQGYEFVTVSDLMKSDSSIPADIAGGDATMPDGCVAHQLKAEDSSSSDLVELRWLGRFLGLERLGEGRRASTARRTSDRTLALLVVGGGLPLLLRSISFLQALGGRCRAVRNFACTMGGAGSR